MRSLRALEKVEASIFGYWKLARSKWRPGSTGRGERSEEKITSPHKEAEITEAQCEGKKKSQWKKKNSNQGDRATGEGGRKSSLVPASSSLVQGHRGRR